MFAGLVNSLRTALSLVCTMFRSETLSQLFDQSCSLSVTGLLHTDRVLRSTHVKALVRDRSEQLGAVVDPLRDSVEVSLIKLALFTPVCLIKGTQKGKVTCYARERVNKNKLF